MTKSTPQHCSQNVLFKLILERHIVHYIFYFRWDFCPNKNAVVFDGTLTIVCSRLRYCKNRFIFCPCGITMTNRNEIFCESIWAGMITYAPHKFCCFEKVNFPYFHDLLHFISITYCVVAIFHGVNWRFSTSAASNPCQMKSHVVNAI